MEKKKLTQNELIHRLKKDKAEAISYLIEFSKSEKFVAAKKRLQQKKLIA